MCNNADGINFNFVTFDESSKVDFDKLQELRPATPLGQKVSGIINLEVSHYLGNGTTLSSFSKIDLDEIEKSWLDHFKKQEPLSVSEFLLNKKDDE